MQILVHRDLNAKAARSITSRIQSAMSDVMVLVAKAYVGRVWIALGYESWPEYIKGEFDHAPLHLPRDERKAVAALLRGQGMSTRAIGAATGTSHETVAQDIAAVRNLTPESDSEVVDAEIVEQDLPPLPANYMDALIRNSTPLAEVAAELGVDLMPEPKHITGLDGKKYAPAAQRQTPAQPAPPQKTTTCPTCGGTGKVTQ